MILSVIIGRFQTPYLHEGHLDLLRQAKQHSDAVLVLIGVSSAEGTDRNPLNFQTRKELFFCNGVVNPIDIRALPDTHSDQDWSDNIDAIIEDFGFSNATIFGGRDNSIEGYYVGKHPIKIIDNVGVHSSTAIRKAFATKVISDRNFRAGIIYHVENRYPIVYSTVDVAVYRMDDYGNLDSILMGKKGDKFNFVGGFVDPQDKNLERAALRELFEETAFSERELLFAQMNYEFSSKVEDSRYKSTKDSIMTHFFSLWMMYPQLPNLSKIQDKEFKEFAWIPATEKSLELIADCHKPLFLKFINSRN